MRNVGNGPVVVHWIATDSIANVVVPTPLTLNTVWNGEKRVWRKLSPHSSCGILHQVIRRSNLRVNEDEEWRKREGEVREREGGRGRETETHREKFLTQSSWVMGITESLLMLANLLSLT